jgi:hypothetical protein
MTWLSFFKDSWSNITSDLQWLWPVVQLENTPSFIKKKKLKYQFCRNSLIKIGMKSKDKGAEFKATRGFEDLCCHKA